VVSWAKPTRVSPERAADIRRPTQERAKVLVAGGDALTAAAELDARATELGDPVLFVDAADAYVTAGEAESDSASIEVGMERARIALDILHFLQDPSADDRFRPIASADLRGEIERASSILRRGTELMDAIEAEELAAAQARLPGRALGKGANPKAMLASGALLTGLGVAGLGLGVAGLVMGQVHQNTVEDPTVYGDEYRDYEAKGKRANILAAVGLAAGGVLAVVGVTLVVVGVKRGARSPDEKPIVRLVPALSPSSRGLAVTGRF
jgi:hypothetical protein